MIIFCKEPPYKSFEPSVATWFWGQKTHSIVSERLTFPIRIIVWTLQTRGVNDFVFSRRVLWDGKLPELLKMHQTIPWKIGREGKISGCGYLSSLKAGSEAGIQSFRKHLLVLADLRDLRFTQSSCKKHFQCGKSIWETVEGLVRGTINLSAPSGSTAWRRCECRSTSNLILIIPL